MAKKRGISSTLGALWRLLIWGLAALLVFAIWLGWSDRTAPPSETTAEAVTEDAAEDAGETAQAEDAGEGDDGSVLESAIETVDQATQSEAEALTEEAEAEAEAEMAQPETEAGTVEVEDDRPGPTPELETTDPAAGAVPSGGAETIALALLGNVQLSLPGDPATYRLVDAIRRDGAIEVTTERTLDGETRQTTRQLSCDPLAAGIVAEDGAVEEMTPVEDGTVDAMIARAVCDALN